MHDEGPGTPYDVSAPIGQIADMVAPLEGETVIVKNYPSAFEKTALDAELKKLGVKNVIYAGFMTHMCVNSPRARRSIMATPTPSSPGQRRRGRYQIPRQARTFRRKLSRTQACRRSVTCSPSWFPAPLTCQANGRNSLLGWPGGASESSWLSRECREPRFRGGRRCTRPRLPALG